MLTPSNIKTLPVEKPPIVVTPPSGSFNVVRPSPPSFPGESTPQWVAVELPPSLMSQIMEQLEFGNKIAVTMTPEMFKDMWEMTHPEPWTPPLPTSHPPIEHGPVKGPESPPGKVVSAPVLPPGKEHVPVSGGSSTTPYEPIRVPIPPSPPRPPLPIGPIGAPLKGPGRHLGKVISVPVLPPGKEHVPVGGGLTTPPEEEPIGAPLPPGAANEWEKIIKREIEHRGPPIWLPMMGGSLAPAPGVSAVAPGTNQQGSAIKLP